MTFTITAPEVTSRLATVTARLLDGNGGPVVNMRTELETAQGGGHRCASDAEGRVRIRNVTPGMYRFTADYTPGRQLEHLISIVRVPPGVTTDLGDIVLSESIELTGTVRTADGKPASGVLVQCTDLDRRRGPRPHVDYIHTVRTGPDGAFTVKRCGRHRYAVHAYGNGVGGHALVDATSGGKPVEITLATTTLIAYRTPAEHPPFTVSLLTADRCPVRVTSLAERDRGTRVPQGAYTLEIHDAEDRLVRSTQVRVGSEPITIDIP
jgi:hypothetical protein